jgi:dihydroorotate dehydrogenase
MNLYQVFRSLIFRFDPETAHELAINFLKYLPRSATIFTLQRDYENLKSNLWNIDFLSPIGLAAGFDKNAEVINVLSKFGFGFVEVGTVTPQPQLGNDKPRIFRLPEDEAIINRLISLASQGAMTAMFGSARIIAISSTAK